MNTEDNIVENQFFSADVTPEQMKILEAKALLKECREYVYQATIARNFHAYPTLAKLDKFVQDA